MVISIGGISNAGKSKLAEKMAAYYTDKSVIVLCQDDYAKPTAEIPKIKGHTNWEIPDSIDFERFYHAVTEGVQNFDHVIAEGLFVCFEKRLLELYQKSIYISISRETFFRRKRKDLRWGKEPEWYMEHIWASNMKYCNELASRTNAFQLSGEDQTDFGAVIRYLES